MRVSIKFLGHLRDELGTEEAHDLFSDSKPRTLSEILKELSRRKGEAFSKTLYSQNGAFNPHITVILNGKVILNDKIEVSDNCSLLFIPFIDGG